VAEKHDVIVVGAGPGGSSTAAWLAESGMDVLVVDKADFPRDKTCGDALSPMAVGLLDRLGLAAELEKLAQPVRGIRFVAPGGGTLQASLPIHARYPKHGWTVPRQTLDAALLAAAQRRGATFYGGLRVGMVRADGRGQWRVEAQGGDRRLAADARLIVLAVGANLGLLERLHLRARRAPVSYAARAYFEGVDCNTDDLEIRFDCLPLPGYGWIFPLPEGRANIGAGSYRLASQIGSSVSGIFDGFIQSPSLQPHLRLARRLSPIKGFPLRTDFHKSECTAPGMILVGEAAGLVNPFTGEGIDYALESGRLAAESIKSCFRNGDFSPAAVGGYEAAVRARFHHYFVLTHWMRRLYMNPIMLDPLIGACQRSNMLAQRLVSIMLSYEPPWRAFTPGVLWRILLASRLTSAPDYPRI
jgi:geranylgeranyl reductase family protein